MQSASIGAAVLILPRTVWWRAETALTRCSLIIRNRPRARKPGGPYHARDSRGEAETHGYRPMLPLLLIESPASARLSQATLRKLSTLTAIFTKSGDGRRPGVSR